MIAQEAGGFVSGAHHTDHDGEVTEDLLLGRKYIVVRSVGSLNPLFNRLGVEKAEIIDFTTLVSIPFIALLVTRQ